MDKEAYYNMDRPLSKTQRKELFAEYAETGDKTLRDILIEEHLYIAEILAKKYTGKGIDYDDIFQVASMGLIFAVERYDPSKGFEFSSFATPTIIGEIKKIFPGQGLDHSRASSGAGAVEENQRRQIDPGPAKSKDPHHFRHRRILGYFHGGSAGGNGSVEGILAGELGYEF